jgi:hypothetical protein
MTTGIDRNIDFSVDPPLQYTITDNLDLHHLHHIVHMCEKRLRILASSDKLTVYPQCPFDDGSLLADQWEPSAEELAEYRGKKAFIQQHHEKTVMKLNWAIAQIRRVTRPDLLQDEIFQDNFDVDKAWELQKTPPPALTRQPGIFEPRAVECVRGPPAGAGRVAPPKPDKVELMNAHYAEQKSLLLSYPQPQARAYAPDW